MADFTKPGFPQAPHIKELLERIQDLENSGYTVPEDSEILISDLRDRTVYAPGDVLMVIENEVVYEFIASIYNADDGLNYIKPNDIADISSGRWRFVKRFSTTTHTHTDLMPKVSGGDANKLLIANVSGEAEPIEIEPEDLVLIDELNQPGGYAGLDESGKLDPGVIPEGTAVSIHTCTKQSLALYILYANEGHTVKLYDLVYVSAQDIYYQALITPANDVSCFQPIGRDLLAARQKLLFTEITDANLTMDYLLYYTNRVSIVSTSAAFSIKSNSFSMDTGDKLALSINRYSAAGITLFVKIYNTAIEVENLLWSQEFSGTEFNDIYTADADYGTLLFVIDRTGTAECELEILEAEITPYVSSGEYNNISDTNAAELTGGGETELHTHPITTAEPEIIEIIEADRTGGLFPIPHTLGVRYPTAIALYNGDDELVSTDNYRLTCTAVNTISLEIYELNIADTWHLSIIANENSSSVSTYDNADLTDQKLAVTHDLGNQYPSSVVLYKENGELISTSNYKYKGDGVNTGTLTDYEADIPDTRQLILTK